MIKERFKSRYIRSIIDDLDDNLKSTYKEYPELLLQYSFLENTVAATLEKISLSGIIDDSKLITINTDKCIPIKNARNRYFARLYDAFMTDVANYNDGRGFKDGTIKDLSQDEIREKIKEMEQWKSSAFCGKTHTPNSYSHLVEYPFYSSLTEKKKIKLWQTDIEYNVSRLCLTKRYKEFIRIVPSLEATFTGDILHTDNPENNYDSLIEEIDNYQQELDYYPSIEVEHTPLMDKGNKNDNSLEVMYHSAKNESTFIQNIHTYEFLKYAMSYFYNEIIINVKKGQYAIPEANVPLNEVTKILFPDLDEVSVSKQFYIERTMKYMINAAEFRLKRTTDDSFSSKAMIDDLTFYTIEKDGGGKQIMSRFTPGYSMLSQMYGNDLYYVMSIPMEALKSNHAKLIFNAIRQERLQDLLVGIDSRVYPYEKIYLISHSTGTKRERFKKYKEAYQEIFNAGLLFADIEYDNTNYVIRVRWLPLTQEEKKDLVSVKLEEIDQKANNMLSILMNDKDVDK